MKNFQYMKFQKGNVIKHFDKQMLMGKFFLRFLTPEVISSGSEE